MASRYYNPQPEDDPSCLDLGLEQSNPSTIAFRDNFYITTAEDARLVLISAPSLDSLGDEDRAQKTTIWEASPGEPYTTDIWSPKLFALGGYWRLYSGASNPDESYDGDANRYRRICSWKGPPSDMAPDAAGEGGWTFCGPLAGMPEHQWAIDPTVFTLHNVIYMVYSGWTLLPEHDDPTCSADRLVRLGQDQWPTSRQNLYIVSLSNPHRVCTRTPVLISEAEYPWEFSDEHGVIGGPTFYRSPNGRWQGLLVSSGAAWVENGYKIGAIEFMGGDPLDPYRWTKNKWPLLQSWIPRFPNEQPFIPAQYRRVTSSLSGPWNKGNGYPLGPGSPTVVWTNSFDMSPFEHGRPFPIPEGEEELDGEEGEEEAQEEEGEQDRYAYDGRDEPEFDYYPDKVDPGADFHLQKQSSWLGRADGGRGRGRDRDMPNQPIAWVIFHATDPGRGGRTYAYAQRLFHSGPGEVPHMRAWVGTPVERTRSRELSYMLNLPRS